MIPSSLSIALPLHREFTPLAKMSWSPDSQKIRLAKYMAYTVSFSYPFAFKFFFFFNSTIQPKFRDQSGNVNTTIFSIHGLDDEYDNLNSELTDLTLPKPDCVWCYAWCRNRLLRSCGDSPFQRLSLLWWRRLPSGSSGWGCQTLWGHRQTRSCTALFPENGPNHPNFNNFV